LTICDFGVEPHAPERFQEKLQTFPVRKRDNKYAKGSVARMCSRLDISMTKAGAPGTAGIAMMSLTATKTTKTP
jgi:hypothetical protein